VDGTGLQEIPDKNIARAMRDKVNSFNKQLLIQAIPIQILFCFFPFQQLVSELEKLL